MGVPKEIHVLLSAKGTEGDSSIFFLPVLKFAEFQKFLNFRNLWKAGNLLCAWKP